MRVFAMNVIISQKLSKWLRTLGDTAARPEPDMKRPHTVTATGPDAIKVRWEI